MEALILLYIHMQYIDVHICGSVDRIMLEGFNPIAESHTFLVKEEQQQIFYSLFVSSSNMDSNKAGVTHKHMIHNSIVQASFVNHKLRKECAKSLKGEYNIY